MIWERKRKFFYKQTSSLQSVASPQQQISQCLFENGKLETSSSAVEQQTAATSQHLEADGSKLTVTVTERSSTL